MKEIFKNDDYLKERTKFYFIDKFKNLESAKIFTDNKSYVVCQSAPGVQTWLWTLDNLSLNKLKELKQVLFDNYVTNEKITFTSKKEVYNYIVSTNDNYEVDEYFEMGTLRCLNAIKPSECDANVDHFHESDLDTAAKYYYLDQKEMELNSDVTIEYSYKHVKAWIENEKFFVLRNNEGKIVSMVGYDTFDVLAKLGNVYTPVEERRNGYCANLVYFVSNKLLNEGFIPMLFTNYNYINSNAAYKKVGYEETGMLVNYTLKKKG